MDNRRVLLLSSQILFPANLATLCSFCLGTCKVESSPLLRISSATWLYKNLGSFHERQELRNPVGSEKRGISFSKLRDVIFRCLHTGSSTRDRWLQGGSTESWASQGIVSQKALADQMSWSIDLTSTDHKSECATDTQMDTQGYSSRSASLCEV